MVRRFFDASVLLYAVYIMLVTVPVFRSGLTYDPRMRQAMLTPCETCKLIDPDHCWSCWISYWGNGCSSCPSDANGIAATLAKR